MMSHTGIEPATTISIIYKNGGTGENRTRDPLLARQMLSQLSYGPILVAEAGVEPAAFGL